jgi:Ricin-type beta-trefoil lectin domain-like
MTNKNVAIHFNEENGANVVIDQRTETGNDFTNWQQWKIIRYCDGSYFFLNKRTNKVIEVYNAATAVLSPLGQMPNNLDANQRWFIEK